MNLYILVEREIERERERERVREIQTDKQTEVKKEKERVREIQTDKRQRGKNRERGRERKSTGREMDKVNRARRLFGRITLCVGCLHWVQRVCVCVGGGLFSFSMNVVSLMLDTFGVHNVTIKIQRNVNNV